MSFECFEIICTYINFILVEQGIDIKDFDKFSW